MFVVVAAVVATVVIAASVKLRAAKVNNANDSIKRFWGGFCPAKVG